MAVKGLGHRHQVLALNLEHLSQIELGVPSVLCLGPQGTTTPSQSRIEFNKFETSLTDFFLIHIKYTYRSSLQNVVTKNSLTKLGTDLVVKTYHLFDPKVFAGIILASKKGKTDVIVMASQRRKGLKGARIYIKKG
jgi:hypothetical protein